MLIHELEHHQQRMRNWFAYEEEISERFIAEYQKDYQTLGLKRHTHNPKVTDNEE